MPEDTQPIATEHPAETASDVTAPVAAVARPAIKRKPAPAAEAVPAQSYAPDGVDAAEWDRYRRWQQEVESKRPEVERTQAELARATKQLSELTNRERDLQRQVAQQAEANFHLVLSAEAASIGQAVSLIPEAHEDLLVYLDRHTHTAQDGTESTVVFRDGKFEVDLNDPDARKKIGEHIVKARPHWVGSRLSAGGGGSGHPAALVGRAKPPSNVDELAAALARGPLTSIAGGRAAGGR